MTSDNIFWELNAAGLSWTLYAESLPRAGWMGGDWGPYVERHNPARWYSDIIASQTEQRKMVPFEDQFAFDLDHHQLPNYSIIIPNVDNDAHDGTVGQADTWLRTRVSRLLNETFFQPAGDGLLIVTFDECDGAVGACPQRVYTAVIGPRVKAGYQSVTYYRHESTLRTITRCAGCERLSRGFQKCTNMAEFFN